MFVSEIRDWFMAKWDFFRSDVVGDSCVSEDLEAFEEEVVSPRALNPHSVTCWKGNFDR